MRLEEMAEPLVEIATAGLMELEKADSDAAYCRAAEQVAVQAKRAVDVVERDRADDEQGAMSAALVHGNQPGTMHGGCRATPTS